MVTTIIALIKLSDFKLLTASWEDVARLWDCIPKAWEYNPKVNLRIPNVELLRFFLPLISNHAKKLHLNI